MIWVLRGGSSALNALLSVCLSVLLPPSVCHFFSSSPVSDFPCNDLVAMPHCCCALVFFFLSGFGLIVSIATGIGNFGMEIFLKLQRMFLQSGVEFHHSDNQGNVRFKHSFAPGGASNTRSYAHAAMSHGKLSPTCRSRFLT